MAGGNFAGVPWLSIRRQWTERARASGAAKRQILEHPASSRQNKYFAKSSEWRPLLPPPHRLTSFCSWALASPAETFAHLALIPTSILFTRKKNRPPAATPPLSKFFELRVLHHSPISFPSVSSLTPPVKFAAPTLTCTASSHVAVGPRLACHRGRPVCARLRPPILRF